MDIMLKNDKEQKSTPVRIICDNEIMQNMLVSVLSPSYSVSKTDATVTVFCMDEGEPDFRGPGIVIGDRDGREDMRIYLSRPLSVSALLFAMQELCRKSIREIGSAYVADSIRRVVACGENEVALTEKEFQLFMLLSEKMGQTVSREEIVCALWQNCEKSNICDVYVTYLRKKLDKLVGKGSIVSVRGVGYMLTNPVGIC